MKICPPIFKVESGSPEFTSSLGEILGKMVKRGDVFCLEGELGSGKTCFVGGLAKGLGIEEIYSPSFIIVAVHQGKIPLYHIDLYRIEEGVELLGLEEYLYGDGVCAIEWAEKMKGLLPPEHLWVRIEYKNEGREITFLPRGERYVKLLKELMRIVSVRD